MTIFGITLSAAVVWLVIAGLLAIIEAFTLGLTTIWFAGGAVAASISAMFGAGTVAVSYTHLDVYKRQDICNRIGFGDIHYSCTADVVGGCQDNERKDCEICCGMHNYRGIGILRIISAFRTSG